MIDLTLDVLSRAVATASGHTAWFDRDSGFLQYGKRGVVCRDMQADIGPNEPDPEFCHACKSSWLHPKQHRM